MAENDPKTPAAGLNSRDAVTKDPVTPEQIKASMERQRKLSERIIAQKSGHLKPGNSEIDTKLTTADHVGQHPAQPYKPDADEARKVGDFARIGAKEGDKVETAAVAPKGGDDDAKPTDHVVLQPGEEEEDAVARIQPGGTKPGELKPVEAPDLKPSGEQKRDVANLPHSGASVENGEGSQGGAEGSH